MCVVSTLLIRCYNYRTTGKLYKCGKILDSITCQILDSSSDGLTIRVITYEGISDCFIFNVQREGGLSKPGERNETSTPRHAHRHQCLPHPCRLSRNGRSPSCLSPYMYDDTGVRNQRSGMDGRMDERTCQLSRLTGCFRDGFVGTVGGRREARESGIRVCFWGAEETCRDERWMEQLSEWNNQPRIKRPLVLYAGTTDAGRSSKYSARRQPEQ